MKKSDRPLILVTNDDGIFAKGLKHLVNLVKPFGDVIVVAPDKPQSAMGHAITVNNVLRLKKYKYDNDVEAYSCSGTPVDCVKLAIYKLLKKKPALLVSGINHGANFSVNVLYSGTMAAAVEGALEGVPSIGFSLCNHDLDANFSACDKVVTKMVENALKGKIPNDVCLNVNIPDVKPEELKGIKVCRQAKAHWQDNFDVREDPFGTEYCWLVGEFKNLDKGEDTDVFALNNNFASVVPVQFDMTAHHAITEINAWDYDME
jgi:5'-nucleotidase